MNYYSPATRYRESSVNTASPMKMVVLLYEAAIRHLKQSAEHIRNRNLEGKRESLDRAMAIVQQLHSSLDMEKGGKIAAELDRLYTYITGRMLEGSAKLETGPLYEAVRLLTNLNSAWEQLAAGEAAKVPSPAAPPASGAIKA